MHCAELLLKSSQGAFTPCGALQSSTVSSHQKPVLHVWVWKQVSPSAPRPAQIREQPASPTQLASSSTHSSSARQEPPLGVFGSNAAGQERLRLSQVPVFRSWRSRQVAPAS